MTVRNGVVGAGWAVLLALWLCACSDGDEHEPTTTTTTTTVGGSTATGGWGGAGGTAGGGAAAAGGGGEAPERPLEGFGADTIGGDQGGDFVVTSLDDSGPGTLRDALSVANRKISFALAGTIELESTIAVSLDHFTVDGSTAPDPGIVLAPAHAGVTSALLSIQGGSHVILRHLRIRDAPDVNTGDNLRIYAGAHHVVVDHCSFRRAADGNLDISDGAYDITVQWSILAETVKNQLIRTDVNGVSLHHNLYVNGDERNPQLSENVLFDAVNNVVFGWAGNYGTRVRQGASGNLIKSYYLPGPGSDVSDAVVLSADAGPVFTEGNQIPPESDDTATAAQRIDAPAVTELTAEQAIAAVLSEAGAQPRDAEDQAYVAEVMAQR